MPDLDRAMAFYRGVLGHQLICRNEATGAGGAPNPRIRHRDRADHAASLRAGLEACFRRRGRRGVRR
ncbi:hypothetical protein EAS64_08805 [Trebonia kvetii]|uniref:Uncharacterized protein n=1 Tax=Trebonia kvetii TaxID=2480626 RepID=A0A6P2C3F3_9ACTN|nr:hypothetical protein EAS64_08805 [Trebonia kvetii]